MVIETKILHYSSYIQHVESEKTMNFWEIKKIHNDMYFLVPKDYDEKTGTFNMDVLEGKTSSSVQYKNKFGKYSNLTWMLTLISEPAINELVNYFIPFNNVYCHFTVNYNMTCREYNYTIKVGSNKKNTSVSILLYELTSFDSPVEIILNYPK